MNMTPPPFARLAQRVVAFVLLALAAPPTLADLLVGSFSTGSVLAYDQTTGAPSGTFSSGTLPTGPIGLALGPDGDVFVTSIDAGTGEGSVLRYDGQTGAFEAVFVAPGSGGLALPQDLLFGPDGQLYVSSAGSDSVLRYDGATGVFTDEFVAAGSGGLQTPLGMAFGPDGDLYVAADFGSGASAGQGVLRFDGATGAYAGVFVAPGSGGVGLPVALTFGPDGHLYVASDFTHTVHRYDGTSGAFIDVFVPAASGGLGFPVDLAFGGDGHLYVSSFMTDSVLRFDASTGAFVDAFVAAGSGGLDGPTGLAFTDPVPLQLSATIDFRPGNAQNVIYPRKQGSIWVAVLSDATFDALQIVPRSARLGRGRIAPGLFHVKDVNRDGSADLLLRFWTPRLGIRCGDTRIRLTAKTWAGDRVAGSDSIRTIGCNPPGRGGASPPGGDDPGEGAKPDKPPKPPKPQPAKPDKPDKPAKPDKPDRDGDRDGDEDRNGDRDRDRDDDDDEEDRDRDRDRDRDDDDDDDDDEDDDDDD